MTSDSAYQLVPPADYFPLARGRFTVTPGLFPITTSFGNGPMDARLFQIDRDFARFRANKVAARAERVSKYVSHTPDFNRLTPSVSRLMMVRLSEEYPGYFEPRMGANGSSALLCRLTRETLHFDRKMRLVSVEDLERVTPPYQDAFDALVSQVPEDVAVITLPETGPDANVALHVTAPSHWAPEEKIGASFLQTHAPVPHFGRVGDASAALLETVRTRPPVVRFNWGIEFTDRLNLHPEPPPCADAEEWNRRRPRRTDFCPLFLRIERQVLWGMATEHALVFTIRVYVRPVTNLSAFERDALCKTLLSMPEESRVYKGLPPETFTWVVDYLTNLRSR